MIENDLIFNNNSIIKENSFYNFISEELFKKYNSFIEKSEPSEGEDLIKFRTKQFVKAKILVEVHHYDNKILIDSENTLALAYYKNQCYDQCIEHLNNCLERLKMKDIGESEKLIYIDILKNLGISYIEIEKYNDANFYLDLAREKCEELLGEDCEEMAIIYNLKGKIENININYKLALEYFGYSKNIYKTLNQKKNFESYKSFLYNYSEINEYLKNHEKSIKYYKKILLFIKKDYKNIIEIIDLKIKIAELYSNIKNEEKVKKKLNGIKEIYENEKLKNKIFLKPLKKLILIYTKVENYNKALEIIKLYEEIEIHFFGKKHINYGKTLFLKASLMYHLNRKIIATELLKESIKIFEKEGDIVNLNSALEKLKKIENN